MSVKEVELALHHDHAVLEQSAAQLVYQLQRRITASGI
jgi:hypothetical protein